MMDLTPYQPAPLAAARAVSDALHQREPIPGLEVTELPADSGPLQWRLAFSLFDRPHRRPELNAWAATVPTAGDVT